LEPEPHHFGGVEAITKCGSGSDSAGSKYDVEPIDKCVKIPQNERFSNFFEYCIMDNNFNQRKS
jgi:hypothetical protein